MSTKTKIQLTVSGPHRQCATERGYGDYYIITDDFCELDHICVGRGASPPVADLKNSLRRIKRRLQREHREEYSVLEFPGFAVVQWNIDA